MLNATSPSTEKRGADMFGRKKKTEVPRFPYDPAVHEPVIRSSICTGEKVAGFRDKNGGTLHEIVMIRDYSVYQKFLQTYNLKEEDVKTIY